MTTKYTFATDCGLDDWVALPRQFKKGETVLRFEGHDYGCARDDMVMGGIATISCSLDGNVPFFTVPVRLLLTEDGTPPVGEYGHGA